MKDIRACRSLEQAFDVGLGQLLDPPGLRIAGRQGRRGDRREARRGLPDAQADKADRGAPVEDDHEDEALRHDGEVHVVPLTLVEEDGELLLSDEVGEPAGGRDVPRGEGGQGRRVEPDDIPDGTEEGPVLVDQEGDLRGGFHQQFPKDRKERLVLRIPEDEIPVAHGRKDTTCPPKEKANPCHMNREKKGAGTSPPPPRSNSRWDTGAVTAAGSCAAPSGG